MGFSLLALLLTVLMVQFLRQQKALERRIASQRALPREQLVPRHYKSFTEVESKLWQAVREQKRSGTWEELRFTQREPEFHIVREYVHGLREDFQRGHRIFGQIIIHSPEMKLFAQLEWERLKIELAYHFWRSVLGFRLRTVGVSIKELRQLTAIVATLAYRVRTMLTALDDTGNIQFVDSILRQS
jgi:hypothetical protein